MDKELCLDPQQPKGHQVRGQQEEFGGQSVFHTGSYSLGLS